MGAGTGTLDSSADTYAVALTFDGGGINEADVLYTHFKSALEWLLAGLYGVGAGGSYQETKDRAGNVTSVSILVNGPLYGTNRENFNRAFNRLLWGVRHRKTPGQPSDSNRTVTPLPQNWQDEST